MTPNYERRTLVLTREPKGGFTVETKVHKQRGPRSEISSDGGQFRDLPEALEFIQEFMK